MRYIDCSYIKAIKGRDKKEEAETITVSVYDGYDFVLLWRNGGYDMIRAPDGVSIHSFVDKIVENLKLEGFSIIYDRKKSFQF